MRPLKRGEVGVSWLTEGGRREILPEIELELLDRTLQPGDFCKRNIDDVRSGIVTDLRVRCRVEHVINKEAVEGWKPSEDIHYRSDAEIGDYVMYNDWIGQVRITSFLWISQTKASTSQVVEVRARLSLVVCHKIYSFQFCSAI